MKRYQWEKWRKSLRPGAVVKSVCYVRGKRDYHIGYFQLQPSGLFLNLNPPKGLPKKTYRESDLWQLNPVESSEYREVLMGMFEE